MTIVIRKQAVTSNPVPRTGISYFSVFRVFSG